MLSWTAVTQRPSRSAASRSVARGAARETGQTGEHGDAGILWRLAQGVSPGGRADAGGAGRAGRRERAQHPGAGARRERPQRDTLRRLARRWAWRRRSKRASWPLRPPARARRPRAGTAPTLRAPRSPYRCRSRRFIGRERELADADAICCGARPACSPSPAPAASARPAWPWQVAAELLDQLCRRRLAGGAGAADATPRWCPRPWPRRWGCASSPDPAAGHADRRTCAPGSCCWCWTTASTCCGLRRLAAALLRACPRLRILATSREALGVAGEQRLPRALAGRARPAAPVPRTPRWSLRGYEAVRAVRGARPRGAPDFALTAAQRAPPWRRSARRLDGIPLALELAAARVRGAAGGAARRPAGRPLPPADRRQPRPPCRASRRCGRPWTGATTCSREPEQALLRRLAVFAGGWTLEAAEAVCAGGGDARPARCWTCWRRW